MKIAAVWDATKVLAVKVWGKLRTLFPVKGDSAFEMVRKSLFLVAAIVLVVSLSMLIYESVVIPTSYNAEMDSIRDIYRPQSGKPGEASSDKEQDPMQLEALREINSDTVGWLTFQSTDPKVGLDIDYPVLQGDDNEYYLNRTFYKKKNKTGSLFLDYRNSLTPRDQSLIIYGHNLSTGLMFSGLNKLVNNLYNARTATTFTLTTDAGTDTYAVFGIMLSNADPEQGPVFNYMRRSFDSAEDFNLFVEELRRRSLYDYPVEVDENDQLLLLSTCVPRRKTQYKGSRTVVMARKLREGESTALNGSITTNKDCLYPLVYYVSKNMPIPNEYTSFTTGGATTTTTGSLSVTVSVGPGGTTAASTTVKTSQSTLSKPSGTKNTVASGNVTSGSAGTTAPSGSSATGSATQSDAKPTSGSQATSATSASSTSATAPSGEATEATASTEDTSATTEDTEPTQASGSTEATGETEPSTDNTEGE